MYTNRLEWVIIVKGCFYPNQLVFIRKFLNEFRLLLLML